MCNGEFYHFRFLIFLAKLIIGKFCKKSVLFFPIEDTFLNFCRFFAMQKIAKILFMFDFCDHSFELCYSLVTYRQLKQHSCRFWQGVKRGKKNKNHQNTYSSNISLLKHIL